MTMSAGQTGGAVGPARCRACGADLAEGAATCGRCGTAQTMATCPLCGATTGASPDAELRFKCDICGGPRIPALPPAARRTGREAAPLKLADAARKSRAGFRAAKAASGALLALNVVMFGIFWLIVGLGAPSAFVFLATAGPLAAIFAWASARAAARGREIQPALDAAWTAAASDVLAQGRGVFTARDLAVALGIDEVRAEELIAMVEVGGATGGAAPAVRTDAMAAFDARLRVATEAAGLPDARVVEQEAAAEEEAAQAARARGLRDR